MKKHIYRTYETLGIAVCVNCTKFKHDIEITEHYIFESGYCDPQFCPRCKAENCSALLKSKPKRKYISLDLEEWQ